MKRFVIALAVLAALGCMQKPAPVSAGSTTVPPDEQLAIAVEYVAVPRASVYARPDAGTSPVGAYGFTEALSVLEKKGEWTRVRTFDGTGWIRQADLMTAEQSKTIEPNVPRFYVEPAAIPFRTSGEIWMQAKVNTDGEVVEVKTTRNTTGSEALGNANADALKTAKFYPMIDDGARKTFVYEHRVYY